MRVLSSSPASMPVPLHQSAHHQSTLPGSSKQLHMNFQTIICLRLVNHQPKGAAKDLYWSSIIQITGSQQEAKRCCKRQEVWLFKIINKSILYSMAFKGNKPRQKNFIFVTKNAAKKWGPKATGPKPHFQTVTLDCWAHEYLETSHY